MTEIWHPGFLRLPLATEVLLGIAAWIVTMVHFVIEPWRWRVAYLPAQSSRLVRNRVRDALYSTALATYLLPFKLGLPLRIALLRTAAKLDIRYIAAVLGLDWLISLSAWSLLAAGSIWVAALHWQPPQYVWILGISGVVVSGILLLLRRRFRTRLFERWREATVVFSRPWRRIVRSAAILLLDVASYGLRHALLVLLVAGSPDLMLAGAAIGIVATFAGILSGLPMGLVGYDATLIALLGASGMSVDQAIAVTLINRGLNIGSAIALGVPASARLGLGSGLRAILGRLRNLANGKD